MKRLTNNLISGILLTLVTAQHTWASTNICQVSREAATSDKAYALERAKVAAVVASNSVRNLRSLTREIDTRFYPSDKEHYYMLVKDLCEQVSVKQDASNDLLSFQEQYLVAVLSRNDMPSLDVINTLYRYTMRDEAYITGGTNSSEWLRLRDTKARLWLRAMERLSQAIDSTIDVAKPVPFEAIPPIEPNGVQLPAGVEPSDVHDPQARVEYLKRIQAVHMKLAKLNEQVKIHQAYDLLSHFAEQYLVIAYSRHPYDVDGLEANLKTYHVDNGFANRVVEEVVRRT